MRLLPIVLMLTVASVVCAEEHKGADVLPADSLRHKEIGLIRETIRELDRTEDDYIEPQHYEFTVMLQGTRTFENFVLRSHDQSITLAPDGHTKVGPFFGWRWFFFGYTFDIKNFGFGSGGLLKEFDLSIYSSKVGVDVFRRHSGSDYKIRDVKLGGIDGDRFEGLPFGGVDVGMTGSGSLQSVHLSEDQLRLVDGRVGIYQKYARTRP